MSSHRKPKIDIGDRYLVTWRNGQQQIGEVIEIRTVNRKKKESTSASMSTGGASASLAEEPEELEFYIHYPSFDRRLDEWVTADRINTDSAVNGDAGDASTKFHKKSKKKNDDIIATAFSNTASGSMTGTGATGSALTTLSTMTSDFKDDKEAMLIALEKENEEITKVKNIQSITLGKYDIETWYFAPYPEEVCGDDRLYACEYCLKYMRKQKTLISHSFKCHMKSPPGREIYRDSSLTMFEIDGKDHKLYCQNLCLLSKLFLDHKTLYYDVDPFLFYVLCEIDEDDQHHIVGYFSKEKQSQEGYNLACILTFPPYQRKGYGKFLISVSYELTKREGLVGSPEKPLSDLGKISYRSYWAHIIMNILNDQEGVRSITIEKISKMTGIRLEDILSTLHSMNMIKYWKGQHVLSVNRQMVASFLADSKRIRLCDPSCLVWQPPEKLVKIIKTTA